MKQAIIATLKSVLKNSDGTSVIETAILLPVFITLFAGISDFGMGFSEKLTTQQAAARAMELATSAGSVVITTNVVRTEAAAAAQVPEGQVVVDLWLECNGTRQSDVNSYCTYGNQTERWMSVVITDGYEPMFGAILPDSIAPNGVISFIGKSTVRLQ